VTAGTVEIKRVACAECDIDSACINAELAGKDKHQLHPVMRMHQNGTATPLDFGQTTLEGRVFNGVQEFTSQFAVAVREAAEFPFTRARQPCRRNYPIFFG